MENTHADTQNSGEKDFVVEIRRLYNPLLLKDKVILVTGGSRGIGRGMAIAFGCLGAKVIINYAGNEAAAKEVESSIGQAGGTAKIWQFNVADFNATQNEIKNIEKQFGPIDVLVNNAGISKDGLIARFSEGDWDATVDTNLKGTFNCCRAVAMSMMKKRQGKIINISSVVGLMGNSGQVAYAASKAGIFGITKSIARELASRNVQVNAIAPGYISTDMTNALDEKILTELVGRIPLGRVGDALDVAKLAIFLASDTSNYITGQTFAVDGGMTMH